jgi:hypothetical protein
MSGIGRRSESDKESRGENCEHFARVHDIFPSMPSSIPRLGGLHFYIMVL